MWIHGGDREPESLEKIFSSSVPEVRPVNDQFHPHVCMGLVVTLMYEQVFFRLVDSQAVIFYV
jgi:hypothetical protein